MANKTRYFAGIDIGTSNIKGALYSSEGDLLSSSLYYYSSFTPRQDWHEQDPDDWVKGVIKVLQDLCRQKYTGAKIESIALSTQGGTIVAVDREYRPLYPAITWLDRRGEEILKHERALAKRSLWFYDRTGWRLDSGLSFLPLYWLKSRRRQLFDKIFKVLFVNDYILRKIIGDNYQDPSNASITLFYNIKEGKWDEEIINIIGLESKYFSEVKASGALLGYLNQDICDAIGISGKVKVINGGHDQYCSAIGAGVLDTNDIMIATGTAWVFFKLLEQPVFDRKRLFAIGRNIIEDKFGLIYSIPCAGASLNWYAVNILRLKEEKELLSLLDKKSELLSKRKNDIIFYPYLTGDFGPDFDIGKKASLLNLGLGHDHLDIAKAIMEGISFQLKKIIEATEEKNIKGERIKLVGGAAKSSIWPSILSDVTGFDILVPSNKNEEFATKGAAIIAGTGSGVFSSLEEGFSLLDSGFKLVSPGEARDFYKEKYKVFKKGY